VNAPVLRIRVFEQSTGSFNRSAKRLSKPMKREPAKAIDELLHGTVTPGRRYEKLKGGEDLYSVRLSQRYRFVFQILENGNAKPVAAGSHDAAYSRT
jgi:plasmid maintenance system killer protein